MIELWFCFIIIFRRCWISHKYSTERRNSSNICFYGKD